MTAALVAGAVAGGVAPVAADPVTDSGMTAVATSGHGHAHGRVLRAWPGADLRKLFASLRAGDTLRLEPGTYRTLSPGRAQTDVLRPQLAAGRRGARITVTAADPAHPPLIVGMVQFDHADWWTVSHLRIDGTIAHTPGLFFNGGTHWVFASSEVFGAAATQALANVAIEGATADGTMPTAWRFTRNCVHGGGTDHDGHPGMMHEVYVTAQGRAGGRITHNVLYDTPDGAAVKIGFGGVLGALGASDVLVAGNTMVDNGRQVLVFGRVDDVTVRGNVMARTTYPMSDGRTRPAVYLNRLVGTGTIVSDNYVWRSNRSIFVLDSPAGSWDNGGGNAVRHRSPQILGTGCAMHASRLGPAQ